MTDIKLVTCLGRVYSILGRAPAQPDVTDPEDYACMDRVLTAARDEIERVVPCTVLKAHAADEDTLQTIEMGSDPS